MTITLIILIITVAMFIWGKVRADIVALTALAALLVFGILTPAEALAGFSSPIVVMALPRMKWVEPSCRQVSPS